MIIKLIRNVGGKLKSAFLDLLPIVVVVSFFQIVVLREPFPNLPEIIVGLLFVVIGLMLFIEGLEIGLFPIGENLSYALTKKGSLSWLLLFSFLLGFSTTIAEPALIAKKQHALRWTAICLRQNKQKAMLWVCVFLWRWRWALPSYSVFGALSKVGQSII